MVKGQRRRGQGVQRLLAVLDAPRHNAGWEACRFRGGPGYGSNVRPQAVGYYSSTVAVYTAVVPVFLPFIHSLQVTIKTNLLAELKNQAPN